MIPDLRLAGPAAIAWVFLVLAIGHPDALPVALAAAIISALLVAIAAAATRSRWRSPFAWLFLALALTAVLLGSALHGDAARRPAALVEAAESGRFLRAEAVVTDTVTQGDSSFTVELRELRIGDGQSSARSPARVFGAAAPSDLPVGALIAVEGTVSSTEPGDELAFLLFSDIPPSLLRGAPGVLQFTNDLRTGFRAAAAELPGDGGALLPGLAIGDTSAVDDPLNEAMIASSLSHLTAVSGANCAVVVMLVMLAAGMLGASRFWRIATSAIALIGFVVLVTPGPSVLRAAVMAAIVLLSTARGRPADGVPAVGLAVIVLLTANPWLARSYGFTLSVLATTGLLVLAGPLARRMAAVIPLTLARVIAVPLAAQLACQPVLVLLNPVIPTFGVLANLLAEPAAPLATVLGLAACLVLPFSPDLGGFLSQVAWLPSAWIAAVARFFERMPGAALPWTPGHGGVVLVTVITMLGLVAVLGPNRGIRLRVRGRLPVPGIRFVAGAACMLILLGIGGAIAGRSIKSALSRPSDWTFAQCDVGQGDAVVVRSGDAVALIDTGPEPAALEACLSTLGIDRIELLVLTHFDLDHVGGADAVEGRVDRVLVGPGDGSAASDSLAAGLAAAGAVVTEGAAGQSGQLGAYNWQLLWPPRPLGGIEPGNPASLTLELEGRAGCSTCVSAIFLGDLGESSQLALASSPNLRPVDVVKVAHHGSSDQSARLYERLQATVGLVGVGTDNGYGHPTASALAILARAGTEVERSDERGLVLVARTDDGALEVWTERAGPEGAVTERSAFGLDRSGWVRGRRNRAVWVSVWTDRAGASWS